MEKSNFIIEIIDKIEWTMGIAFLAVALFIWCMVSKDRYGKKGIIYPILFLAFIIFAFAGVLAVCKANIVCGTALLFPYTALVVYFADKLFSDKKF